MKKLLIILCVFVLAFSLISCDSTDNDIETETKDEEPIAEVKQETPGDDKPVTLVQFSFPAGTVIAGVDVSGLLGNEAYDLINEKVQNYSLTLTVNGKDFTFTAEDLHLQCSKSAVMDYFKALSGGENVEVPVVLSFNTENITDVITNRFNHSAYNADVKYSSSSGKFEIFKESYGTAIDTNSVVAAAEAAIAALTPSAEVTANVSAIKPNITADSSAVTNAVAKANEYLTVALTYTFTPDSGETKSERITKDRIASFIEVDNSFNVYVSTVAVDRVAASLAEKYNVPGESGKFVATGGKVINLTVSYSGQNVDVEALSKDIYDCVSGKISGTRVAPYYEKTVAEDMAYGGNYVEVNMSSQRLWVYKNGECVVSTPIVTGCVYTSHRTPSGIYSVNDKDTGCYLRGADYVSYVNYWVGFIGNSYGLHDATWRSEFGGDIYLYEGSHGCVNIPLGAMGAIYNNVSIGTKVILYGGASNAEPLEQEISGTSVYDVYNDDSPFILDVTTEYAVSNLTYSSSDTGVVTVSSAGEVTVNGIGTATITVTAGAEKYYTSAEFTITVNVYSACSAGRHVYGEWTQITAPTCAPGEEVRKCAHCDVSENKSLPPINEHTPGEPNITMDSTCTAEGVIEVRCTVCNAVISTSAVPVKDHSFSADNPHCLNGCGTANPDYLPPEPETGDGTEEDT